MYLQRYEKVPIIGNFFLVFIYVQLMVINVHLQAAWLQTYNLSLRVLY